MVENSEELQSQVQPEQSPEKKPRTLGDKAKIGLGMTSLAFQQSPGNEAVRAWAGLNIYASTGSPLLAGATVGAVTLAVEGLTGASIAATINSEKEITEKIKNKFSKNNQSEQDANHGSKASDVALALGVGSGAVVAKRHFTDSRRSLKQDMSTNIKTSSLIAGFSAGVATLATGGIDYVQRIGLERTADVAVVVLSDWRTYVGAIALTQGYSFTKKKIAQKRSTT